jgi:peptidoglycan-associated lipoprotein
MKMNYRYAALAIALAALLFGACAKKETSTETMKEEAPVAAAPVTEPMTEPMTEPVTAVSRVAEPVHQAFFAFDSSKLDASAKSILNSNAEWLNDHPGLRITVEGNCDERGTREYNLALGQRRADSVRDYLSSRGVSASRIDTVSFGEERPMCRSSGEACWAQNRRADIVTR